ncbi:hypothetical protein TNCV_5052451 [Trichonephila clavipes]|nr:hypothetical protein TNCV_5052451 [Trichonephila clavipes]
MYDPSSFANPTPPAHADTSRDVLPRGGEGHFARACLDIEVSTNRGNIGNEVRSNLSSETRLKADEEAKAVAEGRKMEEERTKE